MAVADQIVERNKAQVDSVRRQIVLNVRQSYWEAEAAHMVRDFYAQTTDYFRQIIDYTKHDSTKANSPRWIFSAYDWNGRGFTPLPRTQISKRSVPCCA